MLWSDSAPGMLIGPFNIHKGVTTPFVTYDSGGFDNIELRERWTVSLIDGDDAIYRVVKPTSGEGGDGT